MTHHSTKWVLFLASPTSLFSAHQLSHHSAEKNEKMQLLGNGVSMCLSYTMLTPGASPRPPLFSPPLPDSWWEECGSDLSCWQYKGQCQDQLTSRAIFLIPLELGTIEQPGGE